MVGDLGGGGRAAQFGLGAVPLGTTKGLEERDGDKAASIGEGRIASLVPVRVVLPPNDVKEVAA